MRALLGIALALAQVNCSTCLGESAGELDASAVDGAVDTDGPGPFTGVFFDPNTAPPVDTQTFPQSGELALSTDDGRLVDRTDGSVFGTYGQLRTATNGLEVWAITFEVLTLSGDADLRVTGPRPVVLVARESASIAGVLDLASPRARAESGAGNGGDCEQRSGEPGAGIGGAVSSGAGGGAFISDGGSGGDAGAQTAGGGGVGAALEGLAAGCPGGPGGGLGGDGGLGGGGGVLLARRSIAISGVIDAGGGGGTTGGVLGGGGGGGSGGMIAVESPQIILENGSVLVANGGGGAGGGADMGAMDSENGEDGGRDATPAPGGMALSSGPGDGGDGGAGATPDGTGGGGGGVGGGGGGGGGSAGRIALIGQVLENGSALVSPPAE